MLAHQLRCATSNFIPAGKTLADVDANQDGLPDVGEPRGFAIRSDSANGCTSRTTARRSSRSSTSRSTATGCPTAVSDVDKIGIDDYPFDIFFNPVPVQS